MTIQSKKIFLVNITFWGTLILIFYLLVNYALPWLTPFIIALIISAILQKPIKTFSNRTKLNPRLCSVLIMIILFSVLGCFIFLLGYQIVEEISSFFTSLVSNIDEQLTLNSSLSELDAIINILPFNLSDTILKLNKIISDDLINIIKSFALSASSYLTSIATKLPKLLITFILTIVASFFFCMDYDKIKTSIKSMFSDNNQHIISETKKYVITTIFKMIKSYTIIIFITFIELSVGMLFLGVKFPFIIAAIIAFVDILPVLGTGTILIPWGIIEFLMGDWSMGVKILAIYAIITIIRNIIEPKIVGNQIGLHPIITLVSMYVGLQTFGILGIFLFPITILILIQLNKNGLININIFKNIAL